MNAGGVEEGVSLHQQEGERELQGATGQTGLQGRAHLGPGHTRTGQEGAGAYRPEGQGIPGARGAAVAAGRVSVHRLEHQGEGRRPG